jgi:hypothetical protein
LQKANEGLHLARWGHIQPRTAGDEGFRVPEQKLVVIWSEICWNLRCANFGTQRSGVA